MSTDLYQPGQRVRVTQQIPHLGNADPTTAGSVEGTVIRYDQTKTGSWYAHSRDGKLWLDRLVLRKDDGEMVFVNLDRYSSVEVLEAARAPEAPPARESAGI
ncbi:MAG: hypothetical protein SFY69_06150 [Planctomycetota bacterium]|nr:hypothetical protein [Planctomycetota bacterium]